MSVAIYLYAFSKRDNSTKRPDPAVNVPAVYNCLLKEECGIINPIIVIQDIANPSPYNYAYIPYFGRYYWIREWTWVLGRWQASLYTDVLATFKTYIGDSEQYIARSSHTFDGRITDTIYPTIAIDESEDQSLGTPIGGVISEGEYVLGVINDNGGHGAVEYYVLNQSNFSSLCDVMFADNPPWYDISSITKTTPTDITEIALPTEVMKSLVNPMQYIVSCMFFTSKINVPTTGPTNIHFGWWNSRVEARKLGAGATSHIYGQFTLPSHPQANSRGIFLNLAPFTRILFNAGPFGFFPIDTTYFADSLRGSYNIGVDCITGEGVLHIHDDNGNTIAVRRARIGVPIKLAQITRDYIQLASNVIDTGSDIIGDAIKGFAAGGVGGGLAAAASSAIENVNGIASSIKSAMPVLTAGGSAGSLYELNRVWSLTIQHFLLAEEDNANRGRPLAQKRIIKNIPGYIMVDDPDVQTDGLGDETNLIRQYMRGGFFYE